MALIPWQPAWSEALYGSAGLWRREEPCEHFATSVQGIPGTTTILADALARLAQDHHLKRIVDMAAGSGELAACLARRHPDIDVLAIDIRKRPSDLPETVRWHRTPGGSQLGTGWPHLTQTLVIAHEWLDAIPCPILERGSDGELRTVFVDHLTGTEELGKPADREQIDWCRQWWPWDDLPPGARIEVGLPRDRAWDDLLSRAEDALVVAIDYGHLRTARPTYGTLTGYRHGRATAPIPDGRHDLTAHVAVDSLRHDRILTQRQALLDLGVNPGQPDPSRAVTDPARYLAELAQCSAAARMMAPQGLGGFFWVLARTGRSVAGDSENSPQ
ncbi:SAM-dependent methyltransferase [Austwickia sp. TVS 96-490-7B]|uniref:SAM-dependent methyltransferase n=1 Tax=Austwickia sp. TVS 96-490-7B TaxID=2830843 RepID=UPI001C58C30E|nr:SAM-dependent methyltransferase [Austwickia sp. TVS 96-490-7B]